MTIPNGSKRDGTTTTLAPMKASLRRSQGTAPRRQSRCQRKHRVGFAAAEDLGLERRAALLRLFHRGNKQIDAFLPAQPTDEHDAPADRTGQ